MNKEAHEKVLNNLLSTGADFAEIYDEKSYSKKYNYIDSKLDNISYNSLSGVGLRIAKGTEIYYSSLNYKDLSDINALADELKSNISEKPIYMDVKLGDLEEYTGPCEKSYDNFDESKIKKYLVDLDKEIRKRDKRINQVSLTLLEEHKDVTISNYHGIYRNEKRNYTRIYAKVTFKDNELTSSSYETLGIGAGLELLDKDFSEKIDKLIKYGVDKLYAKNCVGKEMPVVLAAGQGAVIFHEACGHAMEAAATAKKTSVLSGKIGEKIATDKVTIIDDGSLEGYWGSTVIDDEGNKTQRNVLIENGVLKTNFNDEINNRLLNIDLTGSSRRQNYHYAPVSRMNNTFLKVGTDKVEDMIKSIDFGLYAADLGGGSVNTETGNFNFECSTAYMIRNGKIEECVKGATLIGNTFDILNGVEMVSNDFDYSVGYCGAGSGNVPVTMGQPTVKISNILVGGVKDDK